jgi:hypothetical protein
MYSAHLMMFVALSKATHKTPTFVFYLAPSSTLALGHTDLHLLQYTQVKLCLEDWLIFQGCFGGVFS